MKKSILSILLAAILLSSTACGDETVPVEETVETTQPTTTAETEPAYDYTGLDFHGEEYRILSTVDYYSMHMQFDRDELTGEALNDAIFNRNRDVENKMNVVIRENALAKEPVWESGGLLVNQIKQAVEGGEDLCDLAFIPPQSAASLVLKGYFCDLLPLEGFRWDEAWYNRKYNDSATLYGKRYFGMSDATIGLTDGMWALYFNEDMMVDYELDLPYELVRDGSWTIDRFQEYVTAVASLGGDTSFDWNKDGNATYGISIIVGAQNKFMHSFGEKCIENIDGKLAFTAGSDRFYQALDKLYTICDTSGGVSISAHADDFNGDVGGNIYVFTAERSLFLAQELGKTAKFRDVEFTYGIVPYPMLDESQGEYYTTTYADAVAFSIPITTADPDRSAVIFDALAFEGMEQVVPVYRENTLEQKGLRNEDSIEMLGIIAEGAFCNVAAMFGMTDLDQVISTELVKHKGSMASSIASYKTKLETRIAKLEEDISK